VQLAPPQYTIWIYDVSKGTLSPILGAEAGMVIVDPVIMQARTPVPAFIPDFVPTPGSAAANLAHNTNGGLGLLVIRSVYDSTEPTWCPPKPTAQFPISRPWPIPSRPKPISARPDCENRKSRRDPRQDRAQDQCLGVRPRGHGHEGNSCLRGRFEPDGSVKIQLPANVPFTIDVLDKNARRIGARHDSWMQLLPGETKTCNGCHVAGTVKTPVPWPFPDSPCR